MKKRRSISVKEAPTLRNGHYGRPFPPRPSGPADTLLPQRVRWAQRCYGSASSLAIEGLGSTMTKAILLLRWFYRYVTEDLQVAIPTLLLAFLTSMSTHAQEVEVMLPQRMTFVPTNLG